MNKKFKAGEEVLFVGTYRAIVLSGHVVYSQDGCETHMSIIAVHDHRAQCENEDSWEIKTVWADDLKELTPGSVEDY